MGLMRTIEKNAASTFGDIFQYSGELIRESIFDVNRENFSGYMWIACLDYSTCIICGSLDGTIFSYASSMEGRTYRAGADGDGVVDKIAPHQPIHQGCRCTMVPILAGMEDDYKAVNYQDWLDRQPPDVLIKILGPSKAALYMKGGIKIDRFVKDGRVAKLKELKTPRVTQKDISVLMSPGEAPIVKLGPNYNESDVDKYLSRVGSKISGMEEEMKLIQELGIKANGQREYVTLVSTDGTIMHCQESKGPGRIDVIMKSIMNLPDNSVIMIHNHATSLSFSGADLDLFGNYPQIAKVIAVGHNGSIYTAILGNKGRPPPMAVKKEYDSIIYRGFFESWARKSEDKNLILSIADELHSNALLETIKKYDIIIIPGVIK